MEKWMKGRYMANQKRLSVGTGVPAPRGRGIVMLILLVLALGSAFGLFMKLLMPQKRSKDNKLIISVALLFAFCGVCALLDISPLLGCMMMGTVYTNIADDDKLFKQLNYFSPPILLLFFVRSGMSFQLDALVSSSGDLNGVPLLVIGVSYFLVRILGKYAGAWLGCRLVKKDKLVRNYLGLVLIPRQAWPSVWPPSARGRSAARWEATCRPSFSRPAFCMS